MELVVSYDTVHLGQVDLKIDKATVAGFTSLATKWDTASLWNCSEYIADTHYLQMPRTYNFEKILIDTNTTQDGNITRAVTLKNKINKIIFISF